MKNMGASRRRFIFLLTSIMQGVWMVNPNTIRAAKQKGKDLVGRIEMELLESSKPKRAMLISSGILGEKTTLYREVNNKKIPVGSINHTGSMIWELCDGNHTFKDICRLIADISQVTETRARRDILAFLAGLKDIGVIRL